jgi:dihydroxy-acid dehydratase
MVNEDLRPEQLLTPAAFRNAFRILNAIGGSTNVVLHLLAIAGRAGVPVVPSDVDTLGRDVPVLVDVEPSGRLLMQDFHAAGGLPELMARLGGLIETDALAATGRPWSEELPSPSLSGGGAIRTADDPLRGDGAFAVLTGSIAPDGALLKTSAASRELFQHTGAALVFHSYEDMRGRIDAPDLDVTPDTVLVLAGTGPVGAPGMPEWGMIPIPAKLAAQGVVDMVRITDSRMSGTSFGTCFLHVAPEAAIGGVIGLIMDGDLIRIDVEGRRLDLLVDESELARRASEWMPPTNDHMRGWPALYRAHVTQSNEGCDLDFLQAPTPAHRRFVPPVVGRS